MDEQRKAFEAWHGGRYMGLQQDIAWAAWQAATLLERERCATICGQYASIEGIAQKCAAAIRSPQ